MKTLPYLIESEIAELRKKYPIFPVEGEHSQHTAGMFIPDVDAFEDSIYSLATNVHNAAIEVALEALPAEEYICGHGPSDSCDSSCSFQEERMARNFYRGEARAKVSALKV